MPTKRWQSQAAIVCEMVLTIIAILHREWGRGAHAVAVADIIFVMMTVRVNDGAGLPPISISEIARRLGMSRTSVRRALVEISEHNGAVRKSGDGYIGNPDYVFVRSDTDNYIPEIQEAIFKSAAQLAAMKPGPARPAASGRKRPVQKPKTQ
ncbi:HTH domain-containing protein [Bradyrhizobium sp. UFLA05-109]